MAEIKKSDLPEEVVEYIDQLEAYAEQTEVERDEALSQLASAVERVDELESVGAASSVEKGDPLADVLAKADPVVRAVLEKQAKELADQKAILAKHEQEQVQQQMVSKASALPKITTPKDELTDTLKSVYAIDGELGDKVFKLLQDANTQLETSSLFNEIGKSGAQSTIASSVESLASELRKSDPTMTMEQAIARAYEVNPNLYLEDLKGN